MLTKSIPLAFDRRFLRDLWGLTKPYWVSEEKKSAWILLSLTLCCVIGQVCANLGFNHFHKIFYNALQDRNTTAILATLQYLVGVCLLLVVASAGYTYVNGLLSLRWRRWLTKQTLQTWLHEQSHYHVAHTHPDLDNPDQRISEDLEKFPALTLNLFFGPYKLLHSLLITLTFSYILWTCSRDFIFQLGTWQGHIPGYAFWVSIIYAAFYMWATMYAGRKLPFAKFQQQTFGADFRYNLIRLRESSEQIALLRGEDSEKNTFQRLFNRIFGNGIALTGLSTRIIALQNSFNYVTYILGLVISLPFFLKRMISLGTVMQISSAFDSVVSGITAFASSFDAFAELRAIVSRLTELKQALHRQKQALNSGITIQTHAKSTLQVDTLTLNLPTGQCLLADINIAIEQGEHVLIQGKAGIGKSTLLRALAGLWRHGEGQIHLPAQASLLFLPQKPYLPLGTLKDIILYPQQTPISNRLIENALILSGLETLTSQLHYIRQWSLELSPGEQQLVALTRIFLLKPTILFLDEATAALDEASENRLYRNIAEHLPQTTIITVGHRSSLPALHDTVLQLPCSLPLHVATKPLQRVAIG